MKTYKLRGKKTVTASNKTRSIKAQKQGRTWKGTVDIKCTGHSEHFLINYTNGTLESELYGFLWDKIIIE